nr:TIGR02678 family protein [Tuberibacillus calidus]
MEPSHPFDEKAMLGLELLFHHYWILRDDNPEAYRLIREREKVLRRYINEKFGMRLIVHQHFIKLEKVPVDPEAWMGIREFQEPMDYAIFCCALSFLEGKAVDEQFLLSELCQEIQSVYPGPFPLDWTVYTHRKSLIRAVKQLMAFHLIRTVDGEIERFDRDENEEVLYEATVYSRYFMRSYPEDFSSYRNWQELLADDWKLNTEDERRKRVYRKLFFSPGIQRKERDDPDFMYIRQFRNRLTEDIESHSDYRLHVYKNTAFLSIENPKQYHHVFPDQKASTDLLLQLSHFLHEHSEAYVPNEKGEILMTEGELEQVIDRLRALYEEGWAKTFREKSTPMIRAELCAVMKEWMMAEEDAGSFIRIKSLLGVMTGKYPDDFRKEETL